MLTNILLALILVVLTIGMMIIEGKLLAILKEIEFFREDFCDERNKKNKNFVPICQYYC